jgi:hypothetical protein
VAQGVGVVALVIRLDVIVFDGEVLEHSHEVGTRLEEI